MTFFERLETLRKNVGISQSTLEKELGISNGSVSKWKKSMPKAETLKLLASYFGVSTEYLLSGQEKEGGEKYYLNEETAKVAQQIFENKELRLLFDTAKDSSAEDIETVHNMLLALKRKEHNRDE